MTALADPVLVISVLVFVFASLLVLVATGVLGHRDRVRRRYAPLGKPGAARGEGDVGTLQPRISVDPAWLGLDTGAQRTLRADLIRAGFFDASAVAVYAMCRLAVLVTLPVAGVLVIPLLLGRWGLPERLTLGVVLLAVAAALPKAYLSQRRRRLEAKYRVTFPDFLDLLVVCINAGLSLEAALDRAARELDDSNHELRANFNLMAAEMRAGKSTTEALRTLAERLGLREARSFAALLHQTIELGTDVAHALTVFSDEMRDKRMARAEEKASALAPKLTLPLGLFIFPVVLIAILAPLVLKVMRVVGH